MAKLELNEFQKGLLQHIVKESYQKVGEKTTIALITLQNGFEIVGTSGCVNPADFDFEIGKHYALVDALTQLGKYVGFYMQEFNHQANILMENTNAIAKELQDEGASAEEVDAFMKELTSEIEKLVKKQGR